MFLGNSVLHPPQHTYTHRQTDRQTDSAPSSGLPLFSSHRGAERFRTDRQAVQALAAFVSGSKDGPERQDLGRVRNGRCTTQSKAPLCPPWRGSFSRYVKIIIINISLGQLLMKWGPRGVGDIQNDVFSHLFIKERTKNHGRRIKKNGLVCVF